MKLRRWFTLLMIAMLPIMAMAQSGTVYPIDLSVMMTPPYGPCLKEYVGSDRINIQALLKDFTKKSDQFVVELKVTDNRNRVVLLTHFGDYDFPAGKTFTYPMGPNSTSAQKSNVLHDLFNNAKIKPKDECFEEGAYTFVFQAFDAHSYGSRKVALSMPFTYPVFLQGNTVQPLQIYPYEHEVICNHAFEYTAKNGIKKIATQLGGIAYQWQSANPTGMRVGYHVQVVDLGEIAGRTKENIESAAQSSFGITDKYILDRRTYTPFCNHDFTAANYVEDHAYAWRVMAVTGDALDKEASFTDKNAPVRVFYFCGAPGIEKDDYVVVKDERKFDKDLAKVKMDTIKSADLNALAMWRDSSVKDAYCGVNVEIRKKGQDKWTPYFVEKTADFVAGKEPTDNNFNFENLSYNTHYEVRAQYVKCDNCSDRTENCVYAPYSDIMEFVIDQPIDSAVCGDNLPKLADCGEGSEIPKVVAGDIIIANGTEVVVDSVSYPNASDSSIISGTAHLCMPMIKNIQLKMEFEEIQINCAKELVMGRIKSVWDETTCAMIDLDEAGGQNSTGGKDNPSSDATVEPYDPATASSKPSGTLMVDGNKNVMFRTDKDGEVVTIGKFVSFTSSEYQSTNYLADNTHYVEFYNEDKVNNAFDNDQQGYYRNITNEYEYFDTPHTNVVLPWLANNPGKQKIIKAREVKKKSTSASFESVLFVIPCESGYIQLETTKDANGNYELNIPGLADVASSTPIYAIARTSDETPYFDAGKMMQANYAERTHKLIIVSLIGDLDASYKTEAEKALNSIYGRVGVSWTVELTKFDNDSIKNEILKDGLSIAADDESCWKKETKEMRAIRKLYSESNEIEDNTAYLFVVNRAQEDNFKDTEGDMPRGQAVGYIFKDKVNDAPKFGRLVAHEIGHGVYKLQHTFDYDGLAEKKAQTDNIMDYNTSKPNDFLAHYQWRVMQDSVMFVWGLFQDDEDGMKIDNLAFVFYHPLAYYMNDNNLSKVVSDYISVSKVPLPDFYEKTKSDDIYLYYEYDDLNELETALQENKKYIDYPDNEYQKENEETRKSFSHKEYVLNSPMTLSAIKAENVKEVDFDYKKWCQEMVNWIDKHYQRNNAFSVNPQKNRQNFYLASAVGNPLDVDYHLISSHFHLNKDILYRVVFNNVGTEEEARLAMDNVKSKEVYYNSDEIQYLCYGYALAAMNLNAEQAAYATLNFYKKAYNPNPESWPNANNAITCGYPWLLDAMYDGFFAYGNRMFLPNFKRNNYTNMYSMCCPNMERMYLEYGMEDVVVDVIVFGALGVNAKVGSTTAKLVGEFTFGAFVDLVIQVTGNMTVKELTLEEALKQVDWSNVVYSGFETKMPDWIHATTMECLRSSFRSLDVPNPDLGEAIGHCTNALLANAITHLLVQTIPNWRNWDRELKWYLEKKLSLKPKAVISLFYQLGIDRTTAEWLLAKLGGNMDIIKLLDEVYR